MATAKKLPSGAWRTQVSKVVNGKKEKKSFTVHPDECQGDWRKAKNLSEMKARDWQNHKITEDIYGENVSSAISNYVKDREKVLSPRTIHDYRALIPLFESIGYISLSDIKTSDIQALINEWSISLSKKTIQNRIGFLISALSYGGCEKKFRLRYPQTATKKVVAPDVEDLHILLQNASEDFRPIICLGAFGSLRRGEICALKQKDISRDMNSVFIHADMVQTDEGIVYKDLPKTTGSIRTVQLPKFVIDMLPISEDPEAFVFDYTINMITSDFTRLRNKCGLKCSFHSLRHFAASFRTDLGIPQKYIEEVGGWKNESTVLKNVYDNTLNSSRKKYTQMANNYLEENFKEDMKRKA